MEGVPKRKEEAAGARALVAWTGESHFWSVVLPELWLGKLFIYSYSACLSVVQQFQEFAVPDRSMIKMLSVPNSSGVKGWLYRHWYGSSWPTLTVPGDSAWTVHCLTLNNSHGRSTANQETEWSGDSNRAGSGDWYNLYKRGYYLAREFLNLPRLQSDLSWSRY
jgi:hypothetical protein